MNHSAGTDAAVPVMTLRRTALTWLVRGAAMLLLSAALFVGFVVSA